MFKLLHIRKSVIIFLLLTLPLSCKNDKFIFPYVHVDIYAGLYSDLAGLGVGSFGFYFNQAGLNGLLIYRDYNDQYFVFDRTLYL